MAMMAIAASELISINTNRLNKSPAMTMPCIAAVSSRISVKYAPLCLTSRGPKAANQKIIKATVAKTREE